MHGDALFTKLEASHQGVYLLRRCISFVKGLGIHLSKYPDAKICFVAKLFECNVTVRLMVERHLFILENKCFRYIVEMRIYARRHAFEDENDL